MLKEFTVLKDRPKMQFRLTRDSVCAGDDVDAPHEQTLEAYSFLDPRAFVSHLARGYLPTVAGFGHSWECLLNDQVIAIVHGNIASISPRLAEVAYSESNHVHFQYKSATF